MAWFVLHLPDVKEKDKTPPVCHLLLPGLSLSVLRLVCRCVSLFWTGGGGGGGWWRGPGGCSEGYVCERSGAALPGLSWLLMMPMERTSRTPSPPASRSSSSSTTPTPGSLTPSPPSPPPGQGSHGGFQGPQQPLGSIISHVLVVSVEEWAFFPP